jgi:hypothetical protein
MIRQLTRVVGLVAVLCGGAAPSSADVLTPVVVSAGSGGGDFFPNACDGNTYKIVAKTINAYVTKTYLFLASPAPAMDAWLFTDFSQIIGEAHRIAATHPVSGLHYWEAERDYGKDSVYVGLVWILVTCYPSAGTTSIEPYAIVYTRPTP